MLKAERAPVDDTGARSLTWAHYQELSDGAFYVGGEALEQPPLRVAVTTPEGALNADTRAELVAEIGEIVDEFVGPYEGRLNHWAMLYEVSEGSWAGGGGSSRSPPSERHEHQGCLIAGPAGTLAPQQGETP
ncbi:MAG: hypothetical protein R3D99_02560 [Altererythrobacter sp.]